MYSQFTIHSVYCKLTLYTCESNCTGFFLCSILFCFLMILLSFPFPVSFCFFDGGSSWLHMPRGVVSFGEWTSVKKASVHSLMRNWPSNCSTSDLCLNKNQCLLYSTYTTSTFSPLAASFHRYFFLLTDHHLTFFSNSDG